MHPQVAADVAVRAASKLGESPVWDAARETLMWVDIVDRSIHYWSAATGLTNSVRTSQLVTAVALRANGVDLVMAVADGFAFLDASTNEIDQFMRLDLPNVRFNDGKCDPAGRFWAGTMVLTGPPDGGALYRLDPPGDLTLVLNGVQLSNGMDWSPAGNAMYYVDSKTGGIDELQFDMDTGDVSGRRRLATVTESGVLPDGMCVDADGCLWVALWGGGCVRRYTPAGIVDREVLVPTVQVTSCAFGGAGLDQLFITTGLVGLSAEQRAAQPHAGDIFVLDTGTCGLASHRYGA